MHKLMELDPNYKTKHLLVRDSIATFFVTKATRQNPTAKILESYILQCEDFVKDFKEHEENKAKGEQSE